MKTESEEKNSIVERFWWQACIMALGAFYFFISVLGTSAWDLTRTFGIVGGALLIASTAFHKPLLILSSVLIGSVPLAILDWWSIVAPALAVAAILISFLRIRRIRKLGPGVRNRG